LEQGLGLGLPLCGVDIDPEKNQVASLGATAVWTPNAPLRFKVTADNLLLPLVKTDSRATVPGTIPFLIYHGLNEGKHTLLIDGKPAATATAKEWAEGVRIERSPDLDQAEKLRQAIVEKNRLYFHRWRPQNVTYLFGFRSKEQGQNAV